MNITFRQLQVFEAVARLLSYTRAAEEMHLSQPAVSMQIKQLESMIGLALFEQVGRRIFLTEAGRHLYDRSREVFEALASYEMTVAELKGLRQGRLRLAVISTAEYFAPRLLGGFCERYPGIDVSLEVTNRERLLQRLAENQDELYIVGQPPEGLDVVAVPFLENPLVVVAPKDHPLVGARGVTLQRLAEEPFIVRERGSGTRGAMQRLFDRHDVKIQVRMELGSNEAIKQAIIGGLGVSVLSRHTVGAEAAAGHLAILDVEHFPIRRHWYVVHPKGRKLSPVAATFLEYLLEEGTALTTPAQEWS